MKKIKKLLIVLPLAFALVFISGVAESEVESEMVPIKEKTMTNKQLQKLLKATCSSVKGDLGFWQCEYNGREVYVITDKSHNRMRIMTAIIKVGDLKQKHYTDMLEANFDRSLDVRYAINDGLVWSCFIHPLGQLIDSQVVGAIKQVDKAANTFGTTYSSSDLVFGGN